MGLFLCTGKEGSGADILPSEVYYARTSFFNGLEFGKALVLVCFEIYESCIDDRHKNSDASHRQVVFKKEQSLPCRNLLRFSCMLHI